MSSRMFNVEIRSPPDVLEALADNMRSAPGLTTTAIKRQGTKFKRRILRKLRREPGAPSYPLRWKSPRQKRAFFATNGFGGGIPYQRTGALSRGWEVDTSELLNDLSFRVYNKEKQARYVIGDDQQPFHIDTGWIFAPKYLAEQRELFEDVLIDTYFTIADPTAGI